MAQDPSLYTRDYHCKTWVDRFVVIIDGKPKILSARNIMSLEIHNDFDNSMESKVLLKAEVSSGLKQQIIANKHKCECSLALHEIGMSVDAEEQVKGPWELCNNTFRCDFGESDEGSDTALLERRAEMDGLPRPTNLDTETDSEQMGETDIVEFYLRDDRLVQANETIHNDVYSYTTPMNQVISILARSNADNVVISPAQNSEATGSIPIRQYQLMTPGDTTESLTRVVKEGGGLYRNPTQYFVDHLTYTTYLVNANGDPTAIREGEPSYVTFIVETDTSQAQPGDSHRESPEDEDNYYIVVPSAQVSHQSDYSSATDFDHASVNNPVIYHNRNVDIGYGRRGRMTRPVTEANQNSITVTGQLAKEQSGTVTFTCNNQDPGIFTCNKAYRVIYTDQERYERHYASYRIVYAHHILNIESEGYHSSSHHITLKRCTAPGEYAFV